jgi:putative two-component system response regulator
VELIRHAAPLHDIGKLGVPDAILLEPGPLTAAERSRMETHTTIGATILAGSDFPLLNLGEQIAVTHHERWDGTGYPNGTKDDAIPLAGRIVAVVDVFDALTHRRPYKPAWSLKAAVAEILRGSGSQFDPAVVSAFRRLHRARKLDDLATEPPRFEAAVSEPALVSTSRRFPQPQSRRT